MITIPERVRVGCSLYAVSIIDGNLVLNGNACYGTIDYNQHTIEISKAAGDEQCQKVAFVHEVLHGIFRDRDIKVEDEEDVVERLAKGLLQLIQDNPKIFKE